MRITKKLIEAIREGSQGGLSPVSRELLPFLTDNEVRQGMRAKDKMAGLHNKAVDKMRIQKQ